MDTASLPALVSSRRQGWFARVGSCGIEEHSHMGRVLKSQELSRTCSGNCLDNFSQCPAVGPLQVPPYCRSSFFLLWLAKLSFPNPAECSTREGEAAPRPVRSLTWRCLRLLEGVCRGAMSSSQGQKGPVSLIVIHPYHSSLYPVDKSRVNEFGESYDEQPKRKPHPD